MTFVRALLFRGESNYGRRGHARWVAIESAQFLPPRSGLLDNSDYELTYAHHHRYSLYLRGPLVHIRRPARAAATRRRRALHLGGLQLLSTGRSLCRGACATAGRVGSVVSRRLLG